MISLFSSRIDTGLETRRALIVVTRLSRNIFPRLSIELAGSSCYCNDSGGPCRHQQFHNESLAVSRARISFSHSLSLFSSIECSRFCKYKCKCLHSEGFGCCFFFSSFFFFFFLSLCFFFSSSSSQDSPNMKSRIREWKKRWMEANLRESFTVKPFDRAFPRWGSPLLILAYY